MADGETGGAACKTSYIFKVGRYRLDFGLQRFLRTKESGVALFAPGAGQKLFVPNGKALTAVFVQNRKYN